MKKTLVGVGIGCGALVVLSLVLVGAGVWWLQHKARSLGGTLADLKAQQEKLAALDARYPFPAPPEGRPLTLSESRLQDYLRVREQVLPVFQLMQQKAHSLNDQFEGAGKLRSAQGAIEAAQAMQDAFRQIRDAYLKALDAQHMGPSEFGAITGAIYAARSAGNAHRREVIQKQIETLEKQLQDPNQPPQMATVLDQQLAILRRQLASLPSAQDDEVLTANAALVARYQQQVDKLGNSAFDGFATLGSDQLMRQLQAGAGPGAP